MKEIGYMGILVKAIKNQVDTDSYNLIHHYNIISLVLSILNTQVQARTVGFWNFGKFTSNKVYAS